MGSSYVLLLQASTATLLNQSSNSNLQQTCEIGETRSDPIHCSAGKKKMEVATLATAMAILGITGHAWTKVLWNKNEHCSERGE